MTSFKGETPDKGHRVTGLGQCSLDQIIYVHDFPTENTREEVLDILTQGGGPAATTLVALARLGIPSNFIGTISDDNSGFRIRQDLKDEGINIDGLKVIGGGRSQRAFVVVNKGNGLRTISWQRATVDELTPGDVDPELITGSDILFLDGLMVDASIEAAKIAKSNSVPIYLYGEHLHDGMMEIAKYADYMVCSEAFAMSLSGTPKDAIRDLIPLGFESVTVTIGKRGSFTAVPGGEFHRPARRVKAVDTTGAGDVYNGAYIYGILQGWEINKIIDFATAFSAMKCLKLGGRTGIPTLEETLNFMDDGDEEEDEE